MVSYLLGSRGTRETVLVKAPVLGAILYETLERRRAAARAVAHDEVISMSSLDNKKLRISAGDCKY